ncbi:hypothetical protein TELCIR_04385 [Teladorsagia circumcincta]|uniref:Uncharacterized protein n=1 Tax=Teladorsagia circumcincta TaxID=45464 RepID=A0A2G9UVU7_TELCI|nr:hypothetical protein TELCIR_04385 [Teladorsagia circumcincta]
MFQPIGGGARPEYPSAVGSPYHPGSAERSPFAPYTSQELPPSAAHRPETHPRADAGVHTTSAPHPTNQVRFRYVKPAAVIKDEHGRLYEGHVEGSEAQHHVDSQASADRAGRPQHPAGAGSEAGHHRVAEHPHHAAPQHPHHEAPQHPAPEHPRHVAPQQPHPATRDQWTQERQQK